MKNIIILSIFSFVLFSCNKDNEKESDKQATISNDPMLIGKWYMDSLETPIIEGKTYYTDTVCDFESTLSTVEFTKSVKSNYSCILGSEISHDFNYKTEKGYILVDGEFSRYNFDGKTLLIVSPFLLNQNDKDSIYSWYSKY